VLSLVLTRFWPCLITLLSRPLGKAKAPGLTRATPPSGSTSCRRTDGLSMSRREDDAWQIIGASVIVCALLTALNMVL
jgi:hypothetical protein